MTSVLPRPARLEPATAAPRDPPDDLAHGLRGQAPPGLIHTGISSPDVSPAVDRSSIRTAVAAIVLGAVVHVLAFAAARTGAIEPSRAMAIDFWVTVGFYLLVAALALARVRAVNFHPVWTDGSLRHGGLLGAAVGLGAAIVVLGFGWVATGEPAGDPRVDLIVSEGTILRLAAAVLVTMVLAPFIEELLFRGLVVESLRSRGATPAVLVGAALFSAWHLNQLALFYYFLMGGVFGYLYWRWGLKASIAAHATFNGAIVLLAILAVVGPSHVVSANGVSAQVPSAWQQSPASEVGAPADLALDGPSGFGLAIAHRDVPGVGNANLDEIASTMNAGAVVDSEHRLVLEQGTARFVDGPGWRGVRVSAKQKDGDGEVVVIPKGDRLYELLLVSGSSGRATSDLDDILSNLSLP